MASGDGGSGETGIPLVSIALFGLLLVRTDTRALGYGVIVFLIVLFFATVALVGGAWALGRRAIRVWREDGDPFTLLRSGWLWGYLAAVGTFWAVWPWR